MGWVTSSSLAAWLAHLCRFAGVGMCCGKVLSPCRCCLLRCCLDIVACHYAVMSVEEIRVAIPPFATGHMFVSGTLAAVLVNETSLLCRHSIQFKWTADRRHVQQYSSVPCCKLHASAYPCAWCTELQTAPTPDRLFSICCPSSPILQKG